jgi:hypothetical protein
LKIALLASRKRGDGKYRDDHKPALPASTMSEDEKIGIDGSRPAQWRNFN